MTYISTTTDRNYGEDVLLDSFKEMAESYSRDILDKTIEFISGNFDPQDIFSEDELSCWAKENGFVEEE